jgi:hypothetical protein
MQCSLRDKGRKENTLARARLCLDGVLSLGEVDVLLLLLLGDERRLVLGESSADGAGLLGSEVEGKVLLALVEEPQLSALVGVDDGEDLGDALANVMNAGELGGGATGDLGSPERDQLRLEVGKLRRELILGLAPELGGRGRRW